VSKAFGYLVEYGIIAVQLIVAVVVMTVAVTLIAVIAYGIVNIV
jgi:hypothetical protein